MREVLMCSNLIDVFDGAAAAVSAVLAPSEGGVAHLDRMNLFGGRDNLPAAYGAAPWDLLSLAELQVILFKNGISLLKGEVAAAQIYHADALRFAPWRSINGTAYGDAKMKSSDTVRFNAQYTRAAVQGAFAACLAFTPDRFKRDTGQLVEKGRESMLVGPRARLALGAGATGDLVFEMDTGGYVDVTSLHLQAAPTTVTANGLANDVIRAMTVSRLLRPNGNNLILGQTPVGTAPEAPAALWESATREFSWVNFGQYKANAGQQYTVTLINRSAIAVEVNGSMRWYPDSDEDPC